MPSPHPSPERAAFEPAFDDAVLGQGLEPAAEAALREAGALRSDPPAAMAALMRAQRLAPEHPMVLIAFYRHYFYAHQLRPARDVARQALALAARQLGLPTLWRQVPEQPLPGADHDAAVRFYLWLLKGYAYLSLRLDDMPEARAALAKLQALDPGDRVGGALLEAVRQRREQGFGLDDDGNIDDEGDGPALPAFGAAAWARVNSAGQAAAARRAALQRAAQP